MDGTSGGLLLVAGMAGGIINAVAGGATLITFPAMLQAGLPPVIANASNAVAILPGHLIAVLADPDRWPPVDRHLAMLLAASLLGGTAGALLLLHLPETLFTKPVPILIAFATLLFAVAPTIQARRRARRTERAAGRTSVLADPVVVGLASIYGGFFGAALGVILTAVLSLDPSRDIRTVKVLKNLLATVVGAAATTIFILQGAVSWPETLVMLGGALLGGYAGGYLIRILPADYVRRIVIAVGMAMSAIYVAKYWL